MTFEVLAQHSSQDSSPNFLNDFSAACLKEFGEEK